LSRQVEAGGPGQVGTKALFSSTAIGLRKYRIPSDLRSQAEYRLVSTMVGDHMGILGVVVFVSGRLEGGKSGCGWSQVGEVEVQL
jgi:hypothetical protein